VSEHSLEQYCWFGLAGKKTEEHLRHRFDVI